jgi:hypothetical protein
MNLWLVCPKWHITRFLWHAEFSAVPFLFLISFDQLTSLYCEGYVYVRVYTYPDCIKIVYQLPLLPNNTASETFIHRLGEVKTFDWITYLWDEYLLFDRMFYNLHFKQEAVAGQLLPPFLPYHVPQAGLYQKCNNYTMK